ncbi:MAG: MotA/TolQ/ExbB proton channel family protein [Bacteroidales bacterium]|nr:MotA/TolQ/ExbB proton channel family protein [Bacteroidales bacterium]
MNPILMIQSDLNAAQSVADTFTSVVGDPAAAVATAEKLSLLDMATKGGWIMLLLVILLALAIYVFIERYIVVARAVKQEDHAFMGSIRQYIHNGNIDSAKQLAAGTDSPIARMIHKGLSRLGRPLSDIQVAIENQGKMEVAQLERRVSLIATVASLGPMIGFLGTVTGMVKAFFQMATAGNNIEISLLANGIYEAMVTTVGGLIVGIICYFLYNLLVTHINKAVMVIESRANEFMDLLHEPA